MKPTLSKIDALNLVLQYCTEFRGIFTTGERILINQQRGYYLSFDNVNTSNEQKMELPDDLKNKVNNVITEIKRYDWEPRKKIEIVWNIEINL